MSLFANMTNDGLEKTGDSLGGSYGPVDTDIHSGVITMAYAIQSAKGAHAMVLDFDLNGKHYNETIYFTNRAGENFFIDKQSKKKVPMPGYTTVNDICLLATEEPLADQEFQEKAVDIYDKEEKKKVPKAVMVATGMLQKPISLAIIKCLESKTVYDEAKDEYIPTEETRDTNYIAKAFHTESKLTVTEAEAGKEEGVFWGAWLERNPPGKVFDKRTYDPKKHGATGRPPAPGKAAPTAGAPAAAAKKIMFGKKA